MLMSLSIANFQRRLSNICLNFVLKCISQIIDLNSKFTFTIRKVMEMLSLLPVFTLVCEKYYVSTNVTNMKNVFLNYNCTFFYLYFSQIDLGRFVTPDSEFVKIRL